MGDSRSRICEPTQPYLWAHEPVFVKQRSRIRESVFLTKNLSISEIIRVRYTSRASPMCGGDDDSESLNLEDKTIKKDKA